jgi:hypothetical protein
MSGDDQGKAVPSRVIADSFFPKGGSPKSLLATVAALTRRPQTGSAHTRGRMPVRSGHVLGMLTALSVAGLRRNHRAASNMPFLSEQESTHQWNRLLNA